MQITEIFALKTDACFSGGGWGGHIIICLIQKHLFLKADPNYWHAKRRKYYANN